jgi:proteasome lid subunit RPN8/RPN11
MIRLYVDPENARLIAAHVLKEMPNEACGALLGIQNQVKQIVPLPNVAASPKTSYRIDDQSLVQTFFKAKQNELAVVGFYHSHPKGDPLPSQTDIQQSAYPDTAYLIVGLSSGEPRLAAWSIQYKQVQPIEVVLASKPIFEAPHEAFTPAQKFAIIAATIIAFLFMIVLSLSLLPPAPIIVAPNP